MKQRLTAGLAIIALALSAATAVLAQTEDEILAAMARWSEVYATATDAAEMLELYHSDAAFWGTGARFPMVGAAEFAPVRRLPLRRLSPGPCGSQTVTALRGAGGRPPKTGRRPVLLDARADGRPTKERGPACGPIACSRKGGLVLRIGFLKALRCCFLLELLFSFLVLL